VCVCVWERESKLFPPVVCVSSKERGHTHSSGEEGSEKKGFCCVCVLCVQAIHHGLSSLFQSGREDMKTKTQNKTCKGQSLLTCRGRREIQKRRRTWVLGSCWGNCKHNWVFAYKDGSVTADVVFLFITFALKMRKVMFWSPCIYLFIYLYACYSYN